ncbi:MAG: acetylxylan esterase [Bacteroidota bacterium]
MKLLNPKLNLFLILTLVVTTLIGQPQVQRVNIIVTPTKSDWTYKLGEQADFNIQVLKDGQPVSGVEVTWELGLEKMDPLKDGKITLKDGIGKITGVKINQPGFLECLAFTEVDGKTYRSRGTAGFSPELIKPTVTNPDDFDDFWDEVKAQLKEIPIDAELTLLPDRCTSKVNVYHLSLRNINNSRFYGILSVPKAPGKYPALLNVPGAGIRPYGPDLRAEDGFITLSVGIHGIPVTMDQGVYDDLGRGALNQYWTIKLDDKNDYYYKRVYLGCVRAIDYIFSMEEFDGENIAVNGGSQGGALSIITAGLDSRIKYLLAYYPALCDLTGYLHDRAGGWPHMFRYYDKTTQPNWLNVAPYYDVVNFARRVKVPGWYSWGFNDTTCPPTSMYAAYNVITANKELNLFLETGHWTFPEQRDQGNAWLMEKLK